jgi:hypothetical protein
MISGLDQTEQSDSTESDAPVVVRKANHRDHFQGLRELMNAFENTRERGEILDMLKEAEHKIGELLERPGRQTPVDDNPLAEATPAPTTEIPAPPAPEGAVPVDQPPAPSVSDVNEPVSDGTPVITDPAADPTPAPAPSVPADQQPPGSQPT